MPGVSREQYAGHMRDAIMAIFGLSHTINTKVGNGNISFFCKIPSFLGSYEARELSRIVQESSEDNLRFSQPSTTFNPYLLIQIQTSSVVLVVENENVSVSRKQH